MKSKRTRRPKIMPATAQTIRDLRYRDGLFSFERDSTIEEAKIAGAVMYAIYALGGEYANMTTEKVLIAEWIVEEAKRGNIDRSGYHKDEKLCRPIDYILRLQKEKEAKNDGTRID